MNKVQIELMKRAAAELKWLRSENLEQRNRLQMFDDVMFLLRTNTGGGGMSATNMDTVRELESMAEKAEAENK